jgi:hypothetical protein
MQMQPWRFLQQPPHGYRKQINVDAAIQQHHQTSYQQQASHCKPFSQKTNWNV